MVPRIQLLVSQALLLTWIAVGCSTSDARLDPRFLVNYLNQLGFDSKVSDTAIVDQKTAERFELPPAARADLWRKLKTFQSKAYGAVETDLELRLTKQNGEVMSIFVATNNLLRVEYGATDGLSSNSSEGVIFAGKEALYEYLSSLPQHPREH